VRETKEPLRAVPRRATFVGIVVLTALVVFCLDRLESEMATRRLQAALARTSHDLTLHFAHFFRERAMALEMLIEAVNESGLHADPEPVHQFAALGDGALGPLDGAQFAMLLDEEVNPVATWHRDAMDVSWRTLFVRYHKVLREVVTRAKREGGIAVSKAVPVPEGDFIFFVATPASCIGSERVTAAAACYYLWRPACRLFNIGLDREYLVFLKDPYDTIISDRTLLPSDRARYRTTFWSGDAFWSLYVHPGPAAGSASNLARMVIWGLGLILLLGFSLFYLLLAEKNNALAAYSRNVEQKARTIASINKKLMSMNQELDDFTYTVAHDLKEPLRGIEGLTRLLEDECGSKLDAAGREYLTLIKQSGLRMQRLVGDLLRLARTTRRSYPSEDVDFNELVAEVLAQFRYDVQRSGARITTRGHLPTLRVDRVRIAEVFHNLISNALKFRGDRPPQIEIGCERVPEGHLFWVRDNGIGIAPEDRERIFHLFCRGSNGNGAQGSGVGLAICKKIVERHGGTIWVESEPGAGTRVCFTLRGTPGTRQATSPTERARTAPWIGAPS